MKVLSWQHHASLTLGTTAVLAVGAASADTPAPDTTSWKCTQCPFLQGYEADVEIGALQGQRARMRATVVTTGVDHSGPYADAASSGQLRGNDGSYANYDLERLGLASRDGYIEGGREGPVRRECQL